MIKLKPIDSTLTIEDLNKYVDIIKQNDLNLLVSTLESIEIKASITHLTYQPHKYPKDNEFIESTAKYNDMMFVTLGLRH